MLQRRSGDRPAIANIPNQIALSDVNIHIGNSFTLPLDQFRKDGQTSASRCSCAVR